MTQRPPTIEDRLRAQARGICAALPIDSAAARILAEHARRDRRRRRHVQAAAGLVAGALLAAILGFPMRQDEVASPEKARRDTPAAVIREPATTEGHILLTRLSEAALRDAGSEEAVAIPLLVPVGEWKGRPVVAPVIYVPPHARRIDHTSLTESERSAVERLLKVTSTRRDRVNDIML